MDHVCDSYDEASSGFIASVGFEKYKSITDRIQTVYLMNDEG